MIRYDPFAFASYERFLFDQYQLETDGLYTVSGHYYILCPSLTTHSTALDGSNLLKWFADHRIIGTPIELVDKVPLGATRIDDQIDKIKSPGTGYLITRSDLEYEIGILIPSIFPDYEVQMGIPEIKIIFTEEVTEDGIRELKTIFADNAFPISYTFSYNVSVQVKKDKPQPGLFQFVTSYRGNKERLSKNVRIAWEKDEDNWSSERRKLFARTDDSKIYRDSFDKSQLRGLIDCTSLPPDNIRNYLSIFEQACIVLPGKKSLDLALSALDLNQDEFGQLLQLNKLHVLLPNSLDHYDLGFIERLLELNSNNVHLSRKLTAVSILEESKRNPLFFPDLPASEKKILLQSLDQSLNSPDIKERTAIQKAISDLGGAWYTIPNAANHMGSAFLAHYGIAGLLRSFLNYSTGKDFTLELMVSAPTVSWAAATGSMLIPAEDNKFSTAPFCEMLADLYSGVPDKNWIMQKPAYANFAIEELLVIADKIPVVEFAKTFSAGQINRFREVVLSISNHNSTPEDLEETIQAFNHFVKEYEKNKNHLGMWNIGGFVLGQIGKATGSSFGSWLAKMLTKVLEKKSPNSKVIGSIIDKVEGQVQGAYPSAILVSKMKDRLKKLV